MSFQVRAVGRAARHEGESRRLRRELSGSRTRLRSTKRMDRSRHHSSYRSRSACSTNGANRRGGAATADGSRDHSKDHSSYRSNRRTDRSNPSRPRSSARKRRRSTDRSKDHSSYRSSCSRRKDASAGRRRSHHGRRPNRTRRQSPPSETTLATSWEVSCRGGKTGWMQIWNTIWVALELRIVSANPCRPVNPGKPVRVNPSSSTLTPGKR